MSTSDFTKYMIAKATKQLLETKDFEKISIGEISNYCGISRNTFYYHFKDKYDVISWIFYSEINPIIGTNPSINNWSDSLLALCQYMQDNKTFYIKALQIKGQNSFSECLMNFHFNLVQSLLISSNCNQILDTTQIKTISNFYAFGLTGVISNWAKTGMEGNPQPTIEMLEKFFSGEIFNTLLSL